MTLTPTLALSRIAQTDAEAEAQDNAEALAMACGLLIEALDKQNYTRARYLAERITERVAKSR